MKISNRSRVTLGLVGAAVVAGLAVGGGLGADAAPAAHTITRQVAGSPGSAAATSAAAAVSSSLAASAEQSARARVSSAADASLSAALGTPGRVSAGTSPATDATTTRATPGTTTAVTPTGSDPGSVVLVLDSSRSMRTRTSAGRTRMDEAKQAMKAAIDAMPPGARVGLRVYGATATVHDPLVGTPQGCRDSSAVVPIGPVDKTRLDAVVDAFAPHGYTPTSYALEQAAKDLGPSGRRTIILVSDGQESCGVDPAATAARLRSQGIDLTINTVGLHVSNAAASELEQVATAGGGTYTSATSSSQLQSGLDHILQRMQSGATSGTAGARTTTGATTGGATGPTGTANRTVTGGDVAVAATSTDTSTQGTDGRALPVGFASALVLLLLFIWLSDHK